VRLSTSATTMRFPYVRHRRPPASAVSVAEADSASAQTAKSNQLASVFVLTPGHRYMAAGVTSSALLSGWQPAAYWFGGRRRRVFDSVAGLLHELGHRTSPLAKGRRVSHHAVPDSPPRRAPRAVPSRRGEQVADSVAALEPSAHRQACCYRLEPAAHDQ